MPSRFAFLAALSCCLSTSVALAHDVPGAHPGEFGVKPVPMPFVVETKGPIPAPKSVKLPAGTPVTGKGFWTFVAAPDLVPVPAAAAPFVKGAHGTVMFDAKRDTVYWGLKGAGFVAFSNRLSQSWVVPGDPALARGNIHGADILQRPGQSPLIAAADNEEAQVHLTDGNFQVMNNLYLPPFEPYADQKGFAPTDAAFLDAERIWVTDGYGKAYFFPATVSPPGYLGKIYGGKSMSETPHGITYDPRTQSMLISARAEGRIMQWDMKQERFLAIDGLPPRSTVCDVDLWGDYAVAPCLTDTDSSKAGPIFIVNLKAHSIVATLRPKDELGYPDARSIHGACWYFHGEGAKREVYIVFTAWNPGGIGALKLVNVAE